MPIFQADLWHICNIILWWPRMKTWWRGVNRPWKKSGCRITHKSLNIFNNRHYQTRAEGFYEIAKLWDIWSFERFYDSILTVLCVCVYIYIIPAKLSGKQGFCYLKISPTFHSSCFLFFERHAWLISHVYSTIWNVIGTFCTTAKTFPQKNVIYFTYLT